MKAVDGQVVRKQVQRDRTVAGAGRASEIAQRLVEQPPAPSSRARSNPGKAEKCRSGGTAVQVTCAPAAWKPSIRAAQSAPAFEGAQAGGVIDAEDQDHLVEETSRHLR